jgi:hypothetical protein
MSQLNEVYKKLVEIQNKHKPVLNKFQLGENFLTIDNQFLDITSALQMCLTDFEDTKQQNEKLMLMLTLIQNLLITSNLDDFVKNSVNEFINKMYSDDLNKLKKQYQDQLNN